MAKLNRFKDRCDSCGPAVQAFVRVVKNKLDLLFCVHCYNKHSAVLHATGFDLAEDERDTVNVKPSISANSE